MFNFLSKLFPSESPELQAEWAEAKGIDRKDQIKAAKKQNEYQSALWHSKHGNDFPSTLNDDETIALCEQFGLTVPTSKLCKPDLAKVAQQKLEAYRAIHGTRKGDEQECEEYSEIQGRINFYIRHHRRCHFMNVIDDHGCKLWRFNVDGEVRVFTKEALIGYCEENSSYSCF